MKKILSLIVLFVFAILPRAGASDAVRSRADSAYMAERYAEALGLYRQLEPSASTLYNMGNCYYRLDSLSAAILYYERARLLSPGNENIKFNLTLAQGKTVDKAAPRHEFFFVGWYRSLCHMMNVDAWAYVAVVAFILMLVFLGYRLFWSSGWRETVARVVYILAFVVFVLSNVFAYSQRYELTHRTGAVVMVQSSAVRSTPDQGGKELFVLHAGTRVEVVDSSLKDWSEVDLSDGKRGWIKRSAIEII